jgi:hypothetical protein
MVGSLGIATAAAPTMANGPAPEHGVADVALTELWRTGGEDDDVFFGNVLQVLGGPDGEVYVLDVQLLQVFVFAADGALLRTLGGRGEGPGEVRNANSMLALSDGSLGLGQVLPGRLVMIDRQGDPAGSLRLTDHESDGGGYILLMGGQAHDTFLALTGMRWRLSDSGELQQDMFLRRYGLDGAPGVDYLTKTSRFDATHFVFDELGFDFVWSRFGITPTGQVCFAPQRNAYAIHVCAADGTLERIITRDYESLRRTDADERRARLNTEAIGSQYGQELRGVTVEKTEPDITALWCHPDGTLWVRTSRGDREREPGVLSTVDLFDAQGRFAEQRRLLAPGNPEQDAIHFLPDGRVVVVTGAAEAYRREVNATTAESAGGEERPLEVICYEMR